MSWLNKLNPRHTGSKASRPTGQPIPVTADPETCLMVFQNHWAQVSRILERRDPRTADDGSAVRNYADQMMYLLVEERPQDDTGIGPILEMVMVEDVLDQLLCWHLRGQLDDDKKIEQLKLFDLLVSQSQQPLLRHKPVLNPLMRLLAVCVEPRSQALEGSLVLLLNQVCVSLSSEPSILELFFHAQTDQGPANLLIFSILIPFIHREGPIGQQARDALLLIMAISAENATVGRYIANNSYFCPVLATGLSALYSSLPRKIEVRGDDWHALRREDWMGVSSITMFMNSLEFCNAVIQVAHPLVRNQLVEYVHNGFLVPVMGPALHKTSIEEMIASTAYLDLFLRTVSEAALLKTFLRFIVLHRHDNITILDTLISRISSNSRLCMVSLSLFRTLLTLSCEDIMLQLVLSHVMVSQRSAVKELDLYGKTADKFLSLIPDCCKPHNMATPEHEEEHAVWSKAHGSPSIDSSTVKAAVPKPATPSRISLFAWQQSAGAEGGSVPRSPGGVPGELAPCSPSHGRWEEVSELDCNYLQYLQDARMHIDRCVWACSLWSAPYDGCQPHPGSALSLATDADAVHLRMDHFGPERPHSGPERSHSGLALTAALPTKDSGQGQRLENGQCDVPPGGIAAPHSKKRGLRRGRGGTMPGRGPRGPAGDPLRSGPSGHAALLNGVGDEERVTLPMARDHPDTCLLVKKVRRNGPDRTRPRREGPGPRGGAAEAPDRLAGGPGNPAGSESMDRLIDELLDRAPAEGNGRGLNVERFSQELQEMEVRMANWARADRSVVGTGCPAQGQEEAEAREEGEEEEEEEEEEPEDERSNQHRAEGCQPNTSLARVEPRVPISGQLLEQQGQPYTGSFIAVLFTKLENMLQNSLYVNFLLTGIIAQLACYPQPLLRSFLLNSNMVFQPSVKSLIQVLGTVKNKIEVFAASQHDFPTLLYKARKYLIARGKLDWSESPNSVPPLRRSESLVRSRKPSLGELILRHTNSPTRARQAAQLALQHVREGQLLHSLTGTSIFKGSAEKHNEALRVKNAVYCSLIFSEFLKELAAIAQEHAVTLSPWPLLDRQE
ncbi:FHF complex subunit HOOK-interacting protein 1B isoform X2 [Rhinoraja longicauda]